MIQQITIGNGAGCDVRLNQPGVADEHAVMYLSNDMLCVELLADNTAFLNGNEVSGTYWLSREDVLVIGTSRLDLPRIEDLLRGMGAENGPLFYEMDGVESSDAVEIRRNWWPFIIVSVIVIGVGIGLGFWFYQMHQQKAIQMEKQRVQDSILNAQEMQMDSMTKVLEQFESSE
jgi:hypothetical protein